MEKNTIAGTKCLYNRRKQTELKYADNIVDIAKKEMIEEWRERSVEKVPTMNTSKIKKRLVELRE